MSGAVASRLAVGLVAVLALAWLAVMERNDRLRTSALQSASAQHVARADMDLRRAQLLNPDSILDVERALIEAGSGRVDAAIARLQGVVRREPDNLTAWGDILVLARRADPAVARRAAAAVRRLNPLTASRATSAPLAH